jgi:hypothetical protein
MSSKEEKRSEDTNSTAHPRPLTHSPHHTFSSGDYERKDKSLIIKNVITGGQFSVPYDESETVENVKNKIQDKKGLAPSNQRLIFKGQQLRDDSANLSGLGIKSGDTLFLTRGVLGGGRRRKTRRRKTKRKTKKN